MASDSDSKLIPQTLDSDPFLSTTTETVTIDEDEFPNTKIDGSSFAPHSETEMSFKSSSTSDQSEKLDGMPWEIFTTYLLIGIGDAQQQSGSCTFPATAVKPKQIRDHVKCNSKNTNLDGEYTIEHTVRLVGKDANTKMS